MRRAASEPPLPHPVRARLVCAGVETAPRGVKPPFGLPAWSADEDAARVVLLKFGSGDPGDAVALVAAQIPSARGLPEGALTVVLEHADRGGRGVARLLRSTPSVPLALRCSALLARGYVGIAAGIDPSSREELAWGFAPPPLLF